MGLIDSTMALIEGSDIPNTVAGAPTILLGENAVGSIGTLGDLDLFEITLAAGTYNFSLVGNGGTPLSDTVVNLLNTAGTQIATDDDGGAGNFSLLTFTITSTQTLYVQAQAFNNSSTGGYLLNVTAAQSEPLASIDWGHVVPDNNAATPTVTDINVYFAPGGQSFTDSDGTYTTGAWSTAEYNAALAAFQNYENIANVNFNVVTNAAQADFFMIETTGTGFLGYFNVGGGSVTLNGVNYTLDGHGVFDSGGSGWDAGGLNVGGYGYVTLIHEIGHGMGLAHPHDNGGSSSVMGGVTGPFGSIGTSGLNQGVYTTMSYNDGYYSLYGSTGPGSNNYGWQGSLMALDIAVLQDNYGANTTFNSGNNNYNLDNINAIGTYYECIWDTGGTADSINYSGTRNATINLNAATLTGTAAAGAGGFISSVAGIYGGFTIANGVVIERASGGSGNDTITGNGAANVLSGNSGFDTIRGGNGNDTLNGGNQADNLYGDGNNDTVNGGSGNDRLFGGTGFDTLNGGTEDDSLFGGDNADTLIGDTGNDTLYGETGGDRLFGGIGFDTLSGGTDNDVLYGGSQADTLLGGNNDDTMFGETGADRLFGENGNDTMDGGADGDVLSGGAGFDTITGGTGNDTMGGGANWDTFIFGNGFGQDTINDFDVANPFEKINIAANTSIVSFADLVANHLSTNGSGYAVINDGLGNTITLVNVSAASLSASDFVF